MSKVLFNLQQSLQEMLSLVEQLLSPVPAAESGKWEWLPRMLPESIVQFVWRECCYTSHDGGRGIEGAKAVDGVRLILESQLAQLAKYKRDAEAWEKDHRAMEAMERHSMSVVQCYPDWRACVMGRDHEGVIRASHLDAVLALAASLSQQTGGKE